MKAFKKTVRQAWRRILFLKKVKVVYPGAYIHVCVHFKLFVTETFIHLYSSRADNMMNLMYPSPGWPTVFFQGTLSLPWRLLLRWILPPSLHVVPCQIWFENNRTWMLFQFHNISLNSTLSNFDSRKDQHRNTRSVKNKTSFHLKGFVPGEEPQA